MPAEEQPPFPKPAVEQPMQSPGSKHPNAEALLNAAAKHVFPESQRTTIPPIRQENEHEDAEVTREGQDGKQEEDKRQRKDREEEPIIGGTPLDEMTPMETPMGNTGSGGAGFPFSKPPKGSLAETAIPEGEAITGPTAGDEEYIVKAVRPGFGAGKEIGSVRMGASALMSALNALPWEEDAGDNSSDSEDEEEHHPQDERHSARPSRPKASRMHSSLHTIRPQEKSGSDSEDIAFRRPNEDEARELSEEGKPAIIAEVISGDRRRSSTASSGSMPPGARGILNDQIAKEEHQASKEESKEMARTGSNRSGGESPSDGNVDAALHEAEGEGEEIENRMGMGDGERQRVRREKLGQRLMEVFGLSEREEVIEEMRCWLLRSIMLKGYMYLTARHICFFAHMPDRENVVVKSGPLSKKAGRMKTKTKYWMVLKNDVLSWFESTADPYFPKGNISLQYVSSCEAMEDLRLKIRTPERNYSFIAETESARDEWVKAIQKVMFKTQHEGENVKLVIPLEAILEVEHSPTLEFAETVEIRCVDPDDQMSVDSYFFASFANTDRTIRTIKRLIEARPAEMLPRLNSEPDLTLAAADAEAEHEEAEQKKHKGVLGGLKKALKPLVGGSHSDQPKKSVSIAEGSRGSEETLHPGLGGVGGGGGSAVEDGYDGYPPRQTGTAPPVKGEKGWTGWLKKPVVKMMHSKPSSSGASMRSSTSARSSTLHPVKSNSSRRSSRPGPGEAEHVTEVVEPVIPNSDSDYSSDDDAGPQHPHSRRGARKSRGSFNSDMSARSGLERSDYAMVDGSEEGRHEEGETARKFRSVFSLPDREELIDHFPGYLYRVLPVSGRFFVSTNYFCFRSSQLLYKTKMMIPIRDLYGLKAQKAFRFNHSGLIIVIKGHEEIFLEFSSSERREACVRVLEQRMEEIRLNSPSKFGATSSHQPDTGNLEMRIMEDLDESAPLETRTPPPVSPSGMFESTTSTFLEFKPDPMRVTCLTIGSRGDVQPYIALCKGLQAEGHHTKIATHGEYKDWVEGHGIEFASVGGDPAELMQMCVDNGMFTVSFLKEGLGKFRGWLDDLLSSSWEACQGSDLLIESPSAMGGVHIAEALQIPYYRAFTMPWTRTRAYPHAFAVPEHKKGGAYNYMTYTMFDQVFWRAISGQVNRWRRKTMGIEATNFDKLEQHKIPFLYNFSPSVVPPPLDWTEWIHVTGYWFLENADESAAKDKKQWSPPDGLLEFMEEAKSKGKKIVYIGFGSIVVSDPEEMTRCVCDAVVDADVYAILSKGWSDRGSKKDGDGDKDGKDGKDGKDEKKDEDKEEKKDETKDGDDDENGADGADGVKYPKNIFSIDSIDHSWLFTRIDAACHHGGAGTTGASLRAGIPTIIKPFFGDQAFWSERVESLNVGSAVRKLTVESLSEALKKATTDEKQIAKAKVVGEMIRRENGVVRAIEAIYRDLEYAKSQIKPLPTPQDGSIPLTKMSSLLSKDSISLSGLSLTMSGSIKNGGHKDDEKEDKSSFAIGKDGRVYEHKHGRGHAHGHRHLHASDFDTDPVNSSGIGAGAVPGPQRHLGTPQKVAAEQPAHTQSQSRDTSADREPGSDGSWSVVSQEGRSRAGSVTGPEQEGASAPAAAGGRALDLGLGPAI